MLLHITLNKVILILSGCVSVREMGGEGWLGDVSRSILRGYRKCRTSDGGRGVP